MTGAAWRKLERTVGEVFQPLERNRLEAEQRVAKASRPAPPDSATDRLVRHLEVVELRRQLEAVPADRRAEVLLSLDPSPVLFEAIEGSLVPLVTQELVEHKRRQWLEANAGDALEIAELAGEAVAAAGVIQRQLRGVASTIATVDYGLDAADLDTRPAELATAGMTADEKVEYIKHQATRRRGVHGAGRF